MEAAALGVPAIGVEIELERHKVAKVVCASGMYLLNS